MRYEYPNIDQVFGDGSSVKCGNKLRDEVYQAPPRATSDTQPEGACPNALNTGDKLYSFTEGFVVGSVNSSADFIDFMSQPGAINKALSGAAPYLDTAYKYYRDKLSQGKAGEIVSDAQSALGSATSWLAEYGNKSPFERGVICGELSASMLLAEAGVSISRASMALSEPAFEAIKLQSQPDKIKKFAARIEHNENPGKALERCTASPVFSAKIKDLLDKLPPRVQKFLADEQVEVIPVKSLSDVHSSLEGVQGLYEVRGGQKRIFIAEDKHKGDINGRHCELTLQHEIAHAIDHAGGWHSRTGDIWDAYEADFCALDSGRRQLILGVFGKGNEDILRKEIFAELVSRQAVPDADPFDSFLRGSFPNMDKAVRQKMEIFRKRS